MAELTLRQVVMYAEEMSFEASNVKSATQKKRLKRGQKEKTASTYTRAQGPDITNASIGELNQMFGNRLFRIQQ